MIPFEPAYMSLYQNGELFNRVEIAIRMLKSCRVCPRNCEIDRLKNEIGVCKSGRYAVVSSYFPHFGEEDVLKGWKGSGTIFFSHCNLKCVFCQNFDISWEGHGHIAEPIQLAGMMLNLQAMGCHNINFVTPEHVVPQIVEALAIAVEKGLRLPIVYNTSAFDSLESIKLMDGIIDIYMPDFKFWDNENSRRLMKAKGYPDAAKKAIREMHHQVGNLIIDENGLAKRGLLVRHLVMPNELANTKEIMDFLYEEISEDTFINIMSQYYPAGKVNDNNYSDINRRITSPELAKAYKAAKDAGLHRFDGYKTI